MIHINKPVVYLTGDTNYTRIHYTDGSQELISFTIKLMVVRVLNLIRIHKRMAINPLFLVDVQLSNSRRATVLMRCGNTEIELVVGRRRITEVREALKSQNWVAPLVEAQLED
ncbi:LytTR family transcriptional regulator DNA-binding domain-containing protein [Spirosoma endbachense]|uniref:HTH LytTR-type domain-containing protein n=1 Tax=Spirosoma endbachense TaxID=2666025 RepID=A0A6P1W1L0_9BACT|nr:LytTR family transcriptional regulator DNA-binding domain-containing protein [Spirosoma endbachense]QHV99321.1 hypothetical protein GJR95_31820 [Spirosoma endbachense]